MTRRELREHEFRILFACDFCDRPAKAGVREAAEETGRTGTVWTDPGRVGEQAELYFTHEGGDEIDFPPCDVPPEERAQIRERVIRIAQKVPQIDEILDETSTGWATARMARADLSILRVAVYELLWDEAIPTSVSINEAVVLARKFGGDDSPSFVNGILGKLTRQRGLDEKKPAAEQKEAQGSHGAADEEGRA